jgi:hypothetical protein
MPSSCLAWVNSHGFADVLLDCYSSIASPELESLLATLADLLDSDVAFFQATAREKFEVTNASIDSFFDIYGQEHYRAAKTASTLDGRLLIVLTPVRDNGVEDSIRRARRGAAFLRLMFGDLLVRQHKQRVRFQLEGSKWLPEKYSEPLASAAQTLLDDFMDVENVLTLNFPLNLEDIALEFIDLACANRDEHVRFMLFWTALEYQLRAHPGDSSGSRRAHWCDRVIRSSKISEETKRLRNLRNKLFKEGLDLMSSFDELSLRCLLRLSAIRDRESRSLYISAYERLLDRRDQGNIPKNIGLLRFTQKRNA